MVFFLMVSGRRPTNVVILKSFQLEDVYHLVQTESFLRNMQRQGVKGGAEHLIWNSKDVKQQFTAGRSSIYYNNQSRSLTQIRSKENLKRKRKREGTWIRMRIKKDAWTGNVQLRQIKRVFMRSTQEEYPWGISRNEISIVAPNGQGWRSHKRKQKLQS